MKTVALTQDEYGDLIDARDHAQAMRDIVPGATEMLTAGQVRLSGCSHAFDILA